MRVVVTGATGNLGTSVVGELGNDPQITSLVGLARRIPETQLGDVEWRQADVSTSPLGTIFKGADAVIHLAWLIQPSHNERDLEATNVIGSERVFRAAIEAKVDTVIYVSSVGAYGPASKTERVDESWSTEGIATSTYSRHKASVERCFWRLAQSHTGTRWVALRPGLMFKREAASEIQRYFLGKAIAKLQPKQRPIPIIPRTPNLTIQAVHTGDVARAVQAALHTDVDGPFNLAADPVLDVDTIANALQARTVPISTQALRLLASGTWHARIQPTEAGWLDMALNVPLMSCERARKELDWTPTVSATDALLQLIHGISDQEHFPTPPLQA